LLPFPTRRSSDLVAQAAAREGAAVVVASSRRDRVDRALRSLPASAEGHVVDLTADQAVAEFFQRIDAFDHLVYTAGEPLTLIPLATMEIEDAQAAFDLRFWGAFRAVKRGAPGIRPGGSIVLTTGTAAYRPQPTWAVAASICGAIVSLTRALAVELAPVRVNAVAPGVVKTPLWSGMPEAERTALYQGLGAALPTRRVGEPEDVAKTYLYLMREGY